MVLSTLVGTLLGEICNMEKGINTLVSQLQQLLTPHAFPASVCSRSCQSHCAWKPALGV